MARGYSVAEVIRTAEEVTGLTVKVEMRPRRLGDPPTLVSDFSKARDLLGWKPIFQSWLFRSSMHIGGFAITSSDLVAAYYFSEPQPPA